MVTLFLQNNCSKWVNRFGTNFKKKNELVSEQNACWVNPPLMLENCRENVTEGNIF